MINAAPMILATMFVCRRREKSEARQACRRAFTYWKCAGDAR